MKKKLLTLFLVLIIVISNSSIAFASDQNNSKEDKIKSVKAFDLSDYKKKIKNIKTEKDIYDLSDEAKIVKSKHDDGTTQYVIYSEKPNSVITYKDGSVESNYQIDALLANTVTTYDESSSSQRTVLVYETLKATMYYTRKDIQTSTTMLDAVKIYNAKATLVATDGYSYQKLWVEAAQKGEHVDPTNGNFIAMDKQCRSSTIVTNPQAGYSYSIDTGFSNYYRLENSFNKVRANYNFSVNGSQWIVFYIDVDLGGILTISPSDF